MNRPADAEIAAMLRELLSEVCYAVNNCGLPLDDDTITARAAFLAAVDELEGTP